LDIAAQTVRSIGVVRPNGTGANATKKTSAARSAITIRIARKPGRKEIDPQKRNRNKLKPLP